LNRNINAKGGNGKVGYCTIQQRNGAAEYHMIEEKLRNSVQPWNDWCPKVDRIEKNINIELKIKRFLLLCDVFEGRTYACGDSIRDNTARYRSKSRYNQKSYNLSKDRPSVQYLKENRFDSLFIHENASSTNKTIIFNTKQIFPLYRVFYTIEEKAPLEVDLPPTRRHNPIFDSDFETSKVILEPKRGAFDISSTNDEIFAMVESRFLRKSSMKKLEIVKVEYYVNTTLERRFLNKQEEFTRKYSSSAAESQVVYGFHGTKDASNVVSIMNSNFMAGLKGKLGAAIYFSEDPSLTFNYGGRHHLIMAKLLPGKTRKDVWKEEDELSSRSSLGSGYDSHGKFNERNNSFEEIAIFDNDQILPCYVIHFKQTR